MEHVIRSSPALGRTRHLATDDELLETVPVETFSHGTLDPWFVTGFSDGEASFTFSRSSAQIAMYYAIKLAATDRALLEQIQQFFGGVGRLYDVSARSPGPRSGSTKSAWMYRVTRHTELVRITNHFDAYPLRSEKQAVYEIWRSMVLLKQEFRAANRKALEDLAIELSDRVPRNQRWR